MSRHRSKLSLIVLLGLMLVAAAPLWHGDHGHGAEPRPLDAHGDTAHVCERSPADDLPGGTCLVCLSHRLLTHGSSVVVCGVAAPTSSDDLPASPSALVARLRSGPSGARSPPIVRT